MSYAQERIFLDEQIRFASKGNRMYIISFAYRISSMRQPVSLSRLNRSLRALVVKHAVLRTALLLDQNGTVTQSILPLPDSDPSPFGFTILFYDGDDHRLPETIYSSNLFDLTNGCVLHCHIIRHSHDDIAHNDDLLTDNDIISFSIHHSAFDGASKSIFLEDLALAYQSDVALPIDDNVLQYIDYSVHERELDMTLSRDFWRAQLDGYDLKHGLILPVSRRWLPDSERSGRAVVASFSFAQDLYHSFLSYAKSQNVTLFQLGLATFYAFLFKLSNGQQDLCVASVNANRYRAELRDVIGMFVATLPYRIRLNSCVSFEQLVQQVRHLCLSILEHSHYPLQHIIGSQHAPAFLETMFDCITVDSNIDAVNLDGAVLRPVSLQQADYVAKFDMTLTLVHNTSTGLSCSLVCSEDIFDQKTVQMFADRFSCLLRQLFDPSSISVRKEPLYELCIILPHEQVIVLSLKTNDINRSLTSDATIRELFIQQSMRHSQKLAVELDEQSLTYGELLLHAQKLALVLIDRHGVKTGDIICQCVERSLSMVRKSRMMSQMHSTIFGIQRFHL